LQALQFNEAGELCELTLKIHQEQNEAGSVEEAVDRRLMAMVCSGKGDHGAALEHLVSSSTVFLANGLETDVADVDLTIGDALLALGRDTEAALSYQKALTVFKATKGENHALVASVLVRLAELHLKTGKHREAKTYCEGALRIFGTQGAGHAVEDIVYGLADIAGIYEILGEREQAIALLGRAVDKQGSAPGQTFTTAGIEAQLGILCLMAEKYPSAYTALKKSVIKLQNATDGKRTSFLGLLLNQLGLAAAEVGKISEANSVLEESRTVMEETVGPQHPDTLSICSNLAGTLDALGR
jgi:tetratricopeptide (TPR) repeat protein